jgi:Na+/H+ antiporter NhaD/arsenite permease-like protein
MPTNSAPVDGPEFSRWHTAKGLALIGVVVVLFLWDRIDREIVALAAAGLVLTSRRIRSRDTLGLVDWHLLVLFVGLFVVNGALANSGVTADSIDYLAKHGVDVREVWWLFGGSVVLSNVVSNVPATMLLLPAAVHPDAGTILALTSTLAGNMLIVGSIANIIVVEHARSAGIAVSWKEHAAVGVPITFLSLALAAVCIAAF